MIHCPRCNTELPDGVSFCDACGAPVRNPMPQAQPVYQPFDGGAGAGASGSVVCPVCGTQAIPGEAFCDNCGAALLSPGSAPAYPAAPPPFAAPAPAAPAPAPFAAPAPPAPAYVSQAPAPAPAPAPVYAAAPVAPPPAAAPHLVVISTRAELPLPARDDLILGREDSQSNSFPDVDLNPHGGLEQGVSRRHARITHRAGQYFLEDLNSVNGTLLNQKRIAANSPQLLRTGDHIMLGRLGLTFEA
ncbi:MAG TPA: FHA domain-containing protein [Chloroflexia bacterium]|nr:FHA domain-containing protein [Chloroflexia bacterium]